MLLFLFVYFCCFVIEPCDCLQNLIMTEIFVVEDVDAADHAEIFDWQGGDFSFFQLVKAGAVRKDRDAHILADQVLDGGDVVDLDYHVEVVDVDAHAFKVRNKEIPCAGVWQA